MQIRLHRQMNTHPKTVTHSSSSGPPFATSFLLSSTFFKPLSFGDCTIDGPVSTTPSTGDPGRLPLSLSKLPDPVASSNLALKEVGTEGEERDGDLEKDLTGGVQLEGDAWSGGSGERSPEVARSSRVNIGGGGGSATAAEVEEVGRRE